MNKKKELAKNTIIITIGKLCTQFVSFLLLPLYTALLSTEEYGIVDLITTYVQLLLPVLFMQMDQALFRYLVIHRNNSEKTTIVISSSFVTLIIQILVTFTTYFFVDCFFTIDYLLYLMITLVVMGISSYSLQVTRGLGDNLTYSISSFICGTVTVVFNVILIVFFHMKAEGMLIAGIIGNCSSTLFVIIRVRLLKYIHLNKFQNEIIKGMLKYALPLIPNALIWWIVNASDRSIVLLYLGASANGVLAVSHKFPTLITTFYNIFHISWTESAALHLKEKDKDEFFSSVFDTIFRLFIGGTICLICIMPFIFNIFVNDKYSEAYYQIPIYSIASLFNVIVGLYSVIYISNMQTKEIAKTSFISGIINIVINFLSIRYIGLYAASVSSALAFGIMAIYRSFDIRKYIKQKIDWILIAFSGIIICICSIGYYSNVFVLRILAACLGVGFSMLINLKKLKPIRGFISKRGR